MKQIAELKGEKRWILWAYGTRDGKPTKEPFQPSGSYAKSNDPSTWSTFGVVRRALTQGGRTFDGRAFDGVGLVFTGDGLCGVDVDGSHDPSDKTRNKYEGDVKQLFSGTYCENSVSGNGIHLLCWCDLDLLPTVTEKGRRKWDGTFYEKNEINGLESYCDQRYFCFTGDIVDGCDTIESRTEALRTFLRRYMVRSEWSKSGDGQPSPQAPAKGKPSTGTARRSTPSTGAAHQVSATPTVLNVSPETVAEVQAASDAVFKVEHSGVDVESMTEQEIADFIRRRLNKALNAENGLKLGDLYIIGDWQKWYGSQSQADNALCEYLAGWLDRNPVLIERAFNESALVRDKWTQRADYRAATIKKGIEDSIRHDFLFVDPDEVKAQSVQSNPQAAAPSKVKPKEPVKLKSFTATELGVMDIPEQQFLVDTLLPVGDLMLLSALPKQGKSFLSLDLCLSIALGRSFLGMQTNQCGAVYVDLEEGQALLRRRMDKILKGEKPPANCHFILDAVRLDEGLTDSLGAFIQEHQSDNIKLIVIDTFALVRSPKARNELDYQWDYRDTRQLRKELCEKYGVSVLLVTHNRKMKDEVSSFNEISGTTGLTGGVDGAITLTKEHKGDTYCVLSTESRSVEGQELRVEFDKDEGRWRNLGDAHELEQKAAGAAWELSPIRQTILELVGKEVGGTWSGSASDLMQEGEKIAGVQLASSPQALAAKLNHFDFQLNCFENIAHTVDRKNGSGGAVHIFTRYSDGFDGDGDSDE